MPYLASKSTALSRLTGGIGGRGPGETKLEIDRRRVQERLITSKQGKVASPPPATASRQRQRMR
jgi:GTP-binding protein HflX